MHILDQYKVPRESVDIEALAQRMAWYFKVAAEDTQFLHKHPARRDELFAELYKHPDVKPSVAANQFVPLGGDPDTHLVPADAEIERLTPPKTIEDRVARLHIAWAALMVYNKYKVRYPLLNHSDLGLQVDRRTTQIMDEWRDGEFVRMFPEHAARRAALQGPPITTPPTQARLPTAPPARFSDPGPVGAPKRVSDDEVERLLGNPSALVGTPFVYSPPQPDDEALGYEPGGWKVVSYTVRMGDEGLEHEYQVLSDLEGVPLPMDGSEVRYLLRHSTFAVGPGVVSRM